MDRLLDKMEEGFTTYLVMMMVVVLGIILAGLLPMGGNIARSTAFSQNYLQAQYNAEAGAKRAIVALSTHSTNWKWLGRSTKSTVGAYKVTISDLNGKTTTAPANGTYIIRSEGTIGGFMRTATVQVTIPIDSTFPPKGTALYIGNEIRSNYPVTIETNGYIKTRGEISPTIFFDRNAGIDPAKYVAKNQNITVSGFEVNTIIKDGYLPFKIPDPNNQTVSLSAGKVYYANNPVTISNNGLFEGPTSGFAIVCINGDFTLNATSLNSKGNIVYLVNGNFTLNTGGANFSNTFLYCNNNAFINNSGANFNVELVVKNNLVLNYSLKNSNSIEPPEGLDNYYKQKLGSTTVAVSQWRGKE